MKLAQLAGACVVFTSTAALAAWGIYDPTNMQQVSKSGGAKTCSGIADVAGAVSVKLYSTASCLEDSGNGTAANSPPFNPWSAVLSNPNQWSVDTATNTHALQLLDSNGNVKDVTNPVIVP